MLNKTAMFKVSAAAMAILAGGALADPIGMGISQTPLGQIDPDHPLGVYGPRANPTRGVNPNDRASMALLMYDADLNFTTVNTTGEVNILRGGTATPSGINRNGQGLILFTWDEAVISSSRTIIRATIATSNGEALVPATARVARAGGITAPAVYWSWRMGVVDPINFRSDITRVQLNRASISFSSDGGASYFNTSSHTNTIPTRGDWRPGFDGGELLTSVGDGTNFIMLQYEVSYVPTPGALALLGAGLTVVTRRRRA